MSNRRRAANVPRQRPVRPARPKAPKPPASRSAAAVQRLNQLPRFLVPTLVFALLIFGMLGKPTWLAIACLVMLIAFLTWLTSLSWARTNTRGRFIRETMILLVVLGLISRLAGWS